MQKLMIIGLLLVLALPLTVLAQDDEPLDINGAYTFSGREADGANPYNGTLTVDGFGSVYYLTLQFGKDDEPVTAPAMLIGDVLIDAFGSDGTVCSDTAYVRMPDGTLLGQWLDLFGDHGMGVETLLPTAPTTDFTGNYTLWGFNADGEAYSGTVSIRVENDIYFLDFTYPGEDKGGDVTVTGYGMLTGDLLGVSLVLDVEDTYENCAIYMAQFAADGSFAGRWYDGGILGAEDGTSQ